MAKAALILTPKPTGDESWDFTKCYWAIGEAVTFSGPLVPAGLEGRAGTIQSHRVNRYKRVNYDVLVDGIVRLGVMMEELVPKQADATTGNRLGEAPRRPRKRKGNQ